jgi:hypothetical protein
MKYQSKRNPARQAPKNFQKIIETINQDIIKAEQVKMTKKMGVENNILDDLKKEIKLYETQRLRKSGAKSSRMKPQAKKFHRFEPKIITK